MRYFKVSIFILVIVTRLFIKWSRGIETHSVLDLLDDLLNFILLIVRGMEQRDYRSGRLSACRQLEAEEERVLVAREMEQGRRFESLEAAREIGIEGMRSRASNMEVEGKFQKDIVVRGLQKLLHFVHT
ncbi:hypothetical protein CDL15_Pgr017371 [Punica granatum]|uniref:Uncharacterized protein n=1 Tax=Punica granatum TaxID=22663 RepID=A0A218Y2F6_PUNGR|nr:hypothetical protein CDL15_Pgr017371 [Punica granatum]PKI79408.1 hypothetical protein CRG98_000155 [Punica granatum]